MYSEYFPADIEFLIHQYLKGKDILHYYQGRNRQTSAKVLCTFYEKIVNEIQSAFPRIKYGELQYICNCGYVKKQQKDFMFLTELNHCNNCHHCTCKKCWTKCKRCKINSCSKCTIKLKCRHGEYDLCQECRQEQISCGFCEKSVCCKLKKCKNCGQRVCQECYRDFRCCIRLHVLHDSLLRMGADCSSS